jgi:hypothetical protein
MNFLLAVALLRSKISDLLIKPDPTWPDIALDKVWVHLHFNFRFHLLCTNHSLMMTLL